MDRGDQKAWVFKKQHTRSFFPATSSVGGELVGPHTHKIVGRVHLKLVGSVEFFPNVYGELKGVFTSKTFILWISHKCLR